MKIASTLGLQTIVQVSSKPQLLAALHPSSGLKGLECLCVSGRNMRLWKIDATKAGDVLTDPDCAAAIAAYSTGKEAGGGRLLVLAEGVPAGAQLARVAGLAAVDGVCVGEELLAATGAGEEAWLEALQAYLKPSAELA